MRARSTDWLAIASFTVALVACSGEEPPLDASISSDASIRDSGTDAPRDATTPDAGIDSSVPAIDAGNDAGDACGACVAVSACEVATCIADTCVRSAAPDGTICDAASDQLCVDGACVPRACGDGWRDGTAGPDYEECDDGNTLDGDLCSATCTSVALGMPVTMSEDGYPTRGAPAMAEDGTHAALLVWTADTATREVRARRFTAHGVPVDEGTPNWLTIVTGMGIGADPDPNVAGLAGGGWVVVWEEPPLIHFRLVRPDGSLGARQTAGEMEPLDARDPRVAALGDGFVIVWSSRALSSYDIVARRFGATGAPLGGELEVPEDLTQWEEDPSVAVSGDVWMVTWTRQIPPPRPPSEMPFVRARRFRGDAPIDAMDLDIAPQWSVSSAAADLGGGTFGIAHTRGLGVDPTPWICVIDATTTTGCDGGAGTLTAFPAYPMVYEREPVATSVDPGEAVVAWSWDVMFPAFGGGDLATTSGGSTVLDATRMTIMGRSADNVGAARARGHGIWATWKDDALGFGGARYRVFVRYVPID